MVEWVAAFITQFRLAIPLRSMTYPRWMAGLQHSAIRLVETEGDAPGAVDGARATNKRAGEDQAGSSLGSQLGGVPESNN